jgi:hypothetical protein
VSKYRVGASREFIELQKTTERVTREELKRKLAKLRERIKAAAASRKARSKEIRGVARLELRKVRDKTRELRALLKRASEAARYLSRYAVAGGRVIVSSSQAAALRELAAQHAGITHEQELERAAAKERADTRKWERRRAADRPKVTRGERKLESDSDLRANLPAELVPAFDKFKNVPTEARQWKATPYLTRLDAFLEWAHGHGAQVDQAYRAAELEGYEEQSEADYRAAQELEELLEKSRGARARQVAR